MLLQILQYNLAFLRNANVYHNAFVLEKLGSVSLWGSDNKTLLLCVCHQSSILTLYHLLLEALILD